MMTVDQFAEMNLTLAEAEDYELVEGELVPMPSGTPLHARVRDAILAFLFWFFRKNPIGEAFAEVDCLLGSRTIRRADVSVFLGERIKQIDIRKIPIPFAPDIAVEVLSPSETVIEANRKIHNYLDAGCKEIWLFDAENGDVFIHAASGIRLLQGKDLLESPLLPGFSVAVAELLMLKAE